MKNTVLVAIALLICLISVANSQEPAQLSNLRESFEKEILRVESKYTEALIKLKENYIRSGNLAAVSQIQNEIKLVQQSDLPNWVYGDWRILGASNEYTVTIRPNGTCREGERGADWTYEGNILEIRWYGGTVDSVTVPARESKVMEFGRIYEGKPAKYRLERVKS